MKRSKALDNEQSGFTIMELLVVTTVTAIFIGIIFGFAFEYLKSGLKTQFELSTTVKRMDAVDNVKSLISESSGLIVQPSITDPSSPFTATPGIWPQIHPYPTGTATHAYAPAGTTEPILYFKKHSYDASKVIILQANGSPYEDEYIMYHDKSANKLYLRTLKNSSATGNAAITSCPPASATATCPADKLILDDTTNVEFAFYSKDGTSIDYYTSPDPTNPYMPGPDFPVVEVAEFYLNTLGKADFQATATSRSRTHIRVALRNT